MLLIKLGTLVTLLVMIVILTKNNIINYGIYYFLMQVFEDRPI